LELALAEQEADRNHIGPKNVPPVAMGVVVDSDWYGNSDRLPAGPPKHRCEGWYGVGCPICEAAEQAPGLPSDPSPAAIKQESAGEA
jgi:hypothetical protein